MSGDPRALVAFHLGGRRSAPQLAAFDPRELHPALFARYRDLTALRHDFPLVLVSGASGAGTIRSLSGVADDLLGKLAEGHDPDRVAAHVLRLERELRTLVAHGSRGSLSGLWRTAAEKLASGGDASLGESLDRARAALAVDGDVVACDRSAPRRVLLHVWQTVQIAKAARLRAEIAAVEAKLSDILRADDARSDAGRSPASLKAAVGPLHEETFDFEALSRVLSGSAPAATLPQARRERLRSLLATLGSQRFFADPGPADRAEPHEFLFESVEAAREAYQARLPRLVEVTRALAMAELEARGEYDESRHGAFFEGLGAADLDPQDLARFPDYLVILNADTLAPADQGALMELLSSGPAFKVLVQSDDLSADPAAGIGVRQRQFATMAIGLNEVYVLQAAASHLHRHRERILRGFEYPGPALFSVFSGDPGGARNLPPYLLAAAATESRAFPSIVYDPSAGPDWASRCDLDGNPQVERDWPVYPFACEDRDHQRMSLDIAFTVVDFLACDARRAAHFAPLPDPGDGAGLEPASAVIAQRAGSRPDRLPFVWMVDGGHTLSRVIVDDRLIREARRCREMWHSLQELGGVHNSHAARVLETERREAEARSLAAAPAGAAPTAPASPAAPAAGDSGAQVAAGGVSEAAPVRAPGEPYIDTPRCSSCNECIQLNSRMFAYNQNKQAYIADPDAGTFRQLVEAAESCQVSIIHPGRPRNPREPGLEELIARAAEFD